MSVQNGVYARQNICLSTHPQARITSEDAYSAILQSASGFEDVETGNWAQENSKVTNILPELGGKLGI
jgi:hypothetical protein